MEFSLKWPCLYPVFGHAFTPYPLFQILLILSTKCWNSAFNAQRSRVIFESNYSGLTCRRRSENICSSSCGGAQEKRKDRMKLSLSPEWVGKTSLGPSYLRFGRIFIHSQLRVWCLIMRKTGRSHHLIMWL